MKDENQQILLEGLAADVSAIHKKLNAIKVERESADISSLLTELKLIKEELQGLKTLSKNAVQSTDSIDDQQRLINLRTQIDRITLKLRNEDNFVHYYFGSPKVLMMTLAVIFLSILMGMIGDRLYLNYQLEKKRIENYGE